MIALSRVAKAFGATTALAGVDLEVGPGESLAIVGPRGSGRTTLLRILATLMRPTSGRVEINGIDVASDVFRVRPLIAYAGHDGIDGNRLRVDEYLRFVVAARKRPVSSIEPVTALLGLDARAAIATLAANVQPRLGLAAALVAAPAVLLLDEPFRALETAAHAGLVQWLHDARAGGATIVVSAGAADGMSQICQRVAHLEAGRLVESSASRQAAAGPPAELVGA
jgi:ABC-type multidrug transport system ATPase subunit